MGVVDTFNWLEEHFDDPIKICNQVLEWKNHSGHSEQQKTQQRKDPENPRHFYHYLQDFGMYKPSGLTRSFFRDLKQNQVWSSVGKLFDYYKQKWHGPDVPVFIFPFTGKQGLILRSTIKNKSGLSFHDKLFLFLTPKLTKKEIEALFVHEYHHVCRMNCIDKNIKDYTLLDSIILEGLAETAVEAECGTDYVAPWCTRYSNEQIHVFWKKYVTDNLTVNKGHRLHDRILFGERGLPGMLGYAAGYMVVKQYYDNRLISIVDTFKIQAEEFLEVIGDMKGY